MVNDHVTGVVLADDHPPTRQRIRESLESGGFEILGEASNADRAVEMTMHHHPDVALLDIKMPGNGIRAARDISAALPGTAVVMLTASTDDADLFDALRAGASGYLQKDMDTDRLPHALRGVLNGEAAIPRTLVAKILNEFRAPAIRKPLIADLTGMGNHGPTGPRTHHRSSSTKTVCRSDHGARSRLISAAKSQSQGPAKRVQLTARRLMQGGSSQHGETRITGPTGAELHEHRGGR
jgi:DNA-binding NarL/FixJ family response regulator